MDRPKIRSYQDILEYPGYEEEVDPKIRPLLRILTSYNLKELFPCGLKGCHQPHKEGYFVELADKGVTNVGWVCGEDFGEKFNTEKKIYAEQVLRPKAIAIVQDKALHIKTISHDLKLLAEKAERLSQCKQGMRDRLPLLYRDLNRRAHGGDDRVSQSVELSNKEFENLKEINPGASRYREEFRGVIPGLRLIEVNIREEVISNFTTKANELMSADIASLSTNKLLQWEGWAINFDDTFERVRNLIFEGASFFSPECFHLLAFIATTPAEKSALSKLTVAELLNDSSAKLSQRTAFVEAVVLSKKERDRQKKLEAMLKKL